MQIASILEQTEEEQADLIQIKEVSTLPSCAFHFMSSLLPHHDVMQAKVATLKRNIKTRLDTERAALQEQLANLTAVVQRELVTNGFRMSLSSAPWFYVLCSFVLLHVLCAYEDVCRRRESALHEVTRVRPCPLLYVLISLLCRAPARKRRKAQASSNLHMGPSMIQLEAWQIHDDMKEFLARVCPRAAYFALSYSLSLSFSSLCNLTLC